MEHDFLSIFEKIILFVGICTAIYLFAVAVKHKIELLLLGKNEDRFGEIEKRIKLFVKYALLQKRIFKEPLYGMMHAAFFWGFIITGIETFNIIARGFDAGFHLPFTGNPVFTGIFETAEILVLIALALAYYRRLVIRPNNLSLNFDGLIILTFILGLMLSALLRDGFEIAMAKTPGSIFFMTDAANYFAPAYAGNFLSNLFINTGMGTTAMHVFHNIFWWIHASIVLVFLVYIPASKHSHLIASFFTVFFGRTKPYGQLSAIDMDTEMEKDDPVFGVNKFENYSWRQLLDVYACTECGRCQTQCPAYMSGKPLNPKKIIVDLRHELFDTGEKRILEKAELLKAEKGVAIKDAEKEVAETVEHPLIERVFQKEEIWACTTCLACVQACPVLIEHVDKIVDVRRHLVMMEADMSEQVVLTFNNIETNGNPWGIGSSTRADWTDGLNIKTLAENPEAEYLYFVGCAASFDDKNKKVARALVKIMNEAGIDFAILGNEETCNGDPARRIGNEYLYQTQAKQNIETMNGYNVKKVITACPHCFNTIKNEYIQFGGNYQVMHHTELIYDLIQKGKVKPQKNVDTSVTYHDSCYLGRYNNVYDAPREILKAIPGLKVIEMEKSKENGMCCGAGGGRMWMEETIGLRINEMRAEQASETKASLVASACPFCKTMLTDGINAKGFTEQMQNLDIIEILEKSL
jgi:Fe-S oxidoreductase